MTRTEQLQISIAHELQHHRQGDTKWVYVLFIVKWLCLANPFIHLWIRKISEIQEFACDETLVDQKKVESQAYARCLVEVAQSAIHQKHVPVCATGLTFLAERNILKRRIEKMFNPKLVKPNRLISIFVGISLASLMTATALASKTIVQDRRVTMIQASKMASVAQANSDFPIELNELVLKELNKYVGTPEGRKFMRQSLRRMEKQRSTVENKLRQYNLPSELMAIPLVESGYQNLPEKNKVGWGAGVWMFITSTARRFGLRVDAQVDERLDVDLLTDAAMRYFGSNFQKFKGWPLTILSYNVGESSLQRAIDKTGSNDPWKLIEQGYENDNDYLPKVMAAILIMKNPETVK